MARFSSNIFRISSLLAASVFAFAHNSHAAEWPSQPIRLVVPFPAGGPTDSAARVYADELGKRLGSVIVVENKPGASGAVAAGQFLNAVPDGHTLMMIVTPTILAPHFFETINFDPANDFAPVTKIYDLPNVIAVNPNELPEVKTLQELFDTSSKADPALMYTSSGTGSSGHLSMELMKSRKLTNMEHVAYKGSAPAMRDTVGGVVPVIYADMVTALPQIKAGRINAVAVGTPERVKVLPDVPTMAEQGFGGYEASSWGGVLAPKGTPQDIIDRLSEESREILASEELAARFDQIGILPAFLTPEKTHELLESDFSRWGEVIRDNDMGGK